MKNPKRILLCRTGAIGDVIHTLPLVKLLKKDFPEASIEYLTASNIKSLLEETCPYIDKVWLYEKEKLKETIDQINKESKIDCFFNLHTGFKYFFVNFFNLRARKHFQYVKERQLHATLNFAKTYKKNLSYDFLDRENLLTVENYKSLLEQFELKRDEYICFVPGVGKTRQNRMWKLDNWIDLARNLNKKEKVKIAILGGKEESELISFFEEKLENKVILIDKLNLLETTKIISASKLVISCDTGLIHIASALSKNVIGLYGPTLSLRTGPFNSSSSVLTSRDCKCRKLKYVEPKKCTKNTSFGLCMEEISPLLVEEMILRTYNISACQ